MRALSVLAVALVFALAPGRADLARAQVPAPPDESTADDRTPPRLSYIDGQVSFWRPGAPEWVAAQVNTALAPGDELSTGSPGNFEIQIGARSFVRAWAGTALGLVNQESDFLQVKLTAGHASLDIRALDPGRTVEVDTPNAAFTIDQPGYYRVQVQGDRTSFISRRSGRAIVTPANGQAASIAASEEVVVEGTDAPRVASYAAPPLDQWDQWNYARTDYLADAVSARYVSPGVYGVADLDRYGRWRVISDYGPVWVPTAVPATWAPYTTGSWTWDPDYGWTWVDTAAWGWAPYHYGRWVYVDGFWGWTPGPVIVRPAYSPALVAFLGGGPGASVRVGWVPLGWGEPVIPWWGRPRFVGVPWWGGWGGPRLVNNVVIARGAVVPALQITTYRNLGVSNAVVVVDHQHFGRGPVLRDRVLHVDVRALEPVRGRLDIKPVSASLVPTTVRGIRPSDDRHGRPVVATRPPQARADAFIGGESGRRPSGPEPRLVPAPRVPNAAVESPRAPIGQGHSERPQPPPAPRLGGQMRGPESATPSIRPQAPAGREARPNGPAVTAPSGSAPPAPSPRVEAPRRQPSAEVPRSQPPGPRIEAPRPQASGPRMDAPRPQGNPRLDAVRPQARQLPGEAGDRMSPGRGDGRPSGDPRNPRGGGGESRKLQ